MPALRILTLLLPAMLVVGGPSAQAQSQSVEDRLRDVLRHVTADLRAAQDNQTALQAALDQAQKQRDLLQQQVTQLNVQLAQQAAHPTQPPPAAPSPQQAADAKQLLDQADALKKQNAALQDGLAHWQAAYQQAASLAQSKDAQNRQLSATTSTAQQTLGVCQVKNTKLIAVAEDILHLYQTPGFRSIVTGSWEPVLGFKRVELENIVQDNEDRILDQKYRPGEVPPPAHR